MKMLKMDATLHPHFNFCLSPEKRIPILKQIIRDFQRMLCEGLDNFLETLEYYNWMKNAQNMPKNECKLSKKIIVSKCAYNFSKIEYYIIITHTYHI